jgi:hypothetical protein
MANEVKATLTVNVTKGKFKDPFQPGAVGIDMGSTLMHRPIVVVNTSAYEAVPVGDVTTPRLMYGRSLAGSTSNYVGIGMSTSAASTSVTEFGKIGAGWPFFFGLASGVSTQLKWKANGAACNIDLKITNA